MFYSKEILTRKDSSLGIVWYPPSAPSSRLSLSFLGAVPHDPFPPLTPTSLHVFFLGVLAQRLAATVGSRSELNKLSKKEVNGINVVKTCKDISQPIEPFALRFSSNLMVGVTRVYKQQYNFYYCDVNSTWIRLKKDLAVVQSDNLDMAHPEAKQIERDVFRSLKSSQNLELEIARGNRGKGLAVELGWAPQSTLDLGGSYADEPSPLSGVLSIAPNDERRRKITLDDGSVLTGSGQTSSQAFNIADDALIGDDSGLYIDSEGNLVDYLPEGFKIDEGAFVPMVSETEEMLGKRKRDGDGAAASLEPILGLEEHAEQAPTAHGMPEDYFPFESHEVAQVNKEVRHEGRRRRPVGLVIDHNTMLTREELLESRNNYLRDQEEVHRERDAKNATTSAKAHVNRLLTCPLSISDAGHDLNGFWGDAGGRTLVDRDRVQGRDVERLRGLSRDVGQGDDDARFLYEMVQDVLMGEEPLDPEIGRRQPNFESTNMPAEMSADDFVGLEGGTDTGTGAGQLGGQMPWSMDVLHGSVHSASDSNDFESAFEKATDEPRRRRRATSIGSLSSADSVSRLDIGEEPLIRRHHTLIRLSHSPSRERCRGRRGESGGSGVGDKGGGPGSSMDANDLFMDTGERLENVTGPQVEGAVATRLYRLAYERETANFLEYARSYIKGSGAGFAQFSDLIAGHRRRDVAASAFYHILSKYISNDFL
ncbi:hypothetical protein BGX28_005826 [Mortierella sp. GBA30]|nr:hypothetical protein BGX28_005826 [Mortierella sp. GBA30]